ncbi:hypothetical protein LAHI110946_00355 [Lactococcus hircilactis]
MKFSTRFYRMRRKNRRGFFILGSLFLIAAGIIGGGLVYLLSPPLPPAIKLQILKVGLVVNLLL